MEANMGHIQWRSVVIVALRLLINFLFYAAIAPKFRNPGMWTHYFTTWGYPAWGPPVVSTIEIIGLVALWIPAVALWGSAVLMITTAGATGTWLMNGPRIVAAFPGLVLVLVGMLAWLQQQARVRRDAHARRPEPLAN